MDKSYCSVHRVECFALAIMTWLIFTEFLCHNYHGYAPFVLSTSLSFLNSWFIIAFVARAGCTSWVWTTYPFGAPELTAGVKWDSLCPIFSFLRSILWIVVYPFVPFCLVIVPSSSSLTVYDGCYKWSRHWLSFRSSWIHLNSLQLLSEFRLPRSLYLLLVSSGST